MTDPVYVAALVVVATLASAFFAGAEMALLSADPTLLRSRAGALGKREALVERYLDHPHWFLGAIILGSTLSLVIAAAPLALFLLGREGPKGALLALAVLAPVLVIFGRVLPKLVFHARANALAPFSLAVLRIAIAIFYPLLLLVIGFGWLIEKALVRGRGRESFWYTREQLKLLLTRAPAGLDLNEEERHMIDRVFEFGETLVDEAMIPLVEVEALEQEALVSEALRRASVNMYSRYPVYAERIDNIVGMVETVDLLEASGPDEVVASWSRPVRYVPESKPVDELLFEMQRGNFDFAVVVDEYGGCVGVITREDIVEEIVGDIEDEHDEPVVLYRRTGDGTFSVSARMEIDDINEILEWDLPEGDYETLGGFLLSIFRRVPARGERIRHGDFVFTIEDADERSISRVTAEADSGG